MEQGTRKSAIKTRSIFFLFSMFVGAAKAEMVSSCHGKYSAKIGEHGSMAVEQSGKVIGSIMLDHAIDGGTFSLDDSYLIVFGLPREANVRYAQVTHISLYSLRPRFRLIVKSRYGGGVYIASFDSGQKVTVVENQVGVNVINIKTKDTQSFEAAFVPQLKNATM
ncbi:hypothetical protein [Caballeronia sp. ATUFL_M2_KS44]|uniref:hypothetical protein n=1 Tax=Caballeronia sp. ATUFL_M2_KS44 TaxID=2921767 RepID=UPI002027DB4A|nr:hypothetical protein [Caballeronia sp. ATUFL_M2_KS44]